MKVIKGHVDGKLWVTQSSLSTTITVTLHSLFSKELHKYTLMISFLMLPFNVLLNSSLRLLLRSFVLPELLRHPRDR